MVPGWQVITGLEFAIMSRISSWASQGGEKGDPRTRRRRPRKGERLEEGGKASEDGDSDDDEEDEEEDGAADCCPVEVSDLVAKALASLRVMITEEPERIRWGRMCKRVIDQGRVHYLRAKGYKAEILEYCTLTTSRDNSLIIARL